MSTPKITGEQAREYAARWAEFNWDDGREIRLFRAKTVSGMLRDLAGGVRTVGNGCCGERKVKLPDPSPTGIDAGEREALLGWVRERMAAYVQGAADAGWAWSSESESDRHEMAGWVSPDLFGNDDSGSRSKADALCRLAAGWPS